jgi:hypothetical protein
MKEKIKHMIYEIKTFVYQLVGGQLSQKKQYQDHIKYKLNNYYNMWNNNKVKEKINSFENNKKFFELFLNLLKDSKKWNEYSEIITIGDDFVEFKLFNNYYLIRYCETVVNEKQVKNQYLIQLVEYVFDVKEMTKNRINETKEIFKFNFFGSSNEYYIEDVNKNQITSISNPTNLEVEFNILLSEVFI